MVPGFKGFQLTSLRDEQAIQAPYSTGSKHYKQRPQHLPKTPRSACDIAPD